MTKNTNVISLKWKFAAVLISVLLLLHSIFSFLIHNEISANFTYHRQVLRGNHINIAKALVNESFLVLEQVSEAISHLQHLSPAGVAEPGGIALALDNNWRQWQMSWGLENVALFSHDGTILDFWGNSIALDQSRLLEVLNKELPDRDIVCPELCYQNVIIPILESSQSTGALSVSRSLVDIIIEYWSATKTDLGILVFDATQNSAWPYKLSAMSNAVRNNAIYQSIIRQYTIAELFGKSRIVRHKGRIFEAFIFPVRRKIPNNPPFFILIEDITEARQQLEAELQKFWWFGVTSLSASLGLVLLMLHFFLWRISRLSKSLPLLARHQYDQFRNQLKYKSRFLFGYDELDQLNHTALTLTDQLELLENEVQENTRLLTKKSQELAAERDFINQLVETAPIIVITQNPQGEILSINQTGANEFESDQMGIVGKNFDDYLPESEVNHLNKLVRLRKGQQLEMFQIDGMLLTSSGGIRHISWLHSVMKQEQGDEKVVLTLGVDVSERKIAEEQTHWMATHDQLTGLSNRRDFLDEFGHILSVAERYQDRIALYYLDLDQFKIINDTSGHQAGDTMLQQVAAVLKRTVRESDILSRIGGDEFTLIISNAKPEGVEFLARKIHDALMMIDFSFEGRKYKISCSIGIAIYPEHGITVQELLSNADLAMYQAKESGRGQYHIFSPDKDYQARLTKRMYWKELIETSLDHDRFVLFFQPIQNMLDNRICHYECLIRMVMENDRIVMPGEFIGYAEELGLIGSIDRMVIKLAVQQHLLFQRQQKQISLSINLSGFSFNDTEIFSDIAELLNIRDVNPALFIFEITETAAVSNFTAAQLLIKKIKALGCQISLDDFGVGFSSFYYLKHLPVDFVKIDGTFVQQIDKNDEDKIFVKAITEVSQALGKKTIAEFVENEEILAILKEFGIDYAQGYFIGKPARLV